MYSLGLCDLSSMRMTHTLRTMSGRAKPYVVNEDSPLTREQQADAQRLKQVFVSWQRVREGMGRSSDEYSQKAVAEALGITQGALSQFLNAHTAIHPTFLLRICKVIGADPGVISPSLAEVARQEAQAWGFAKVSRIHAQEARGSGLAQDQTQKHRARKGTSKRRQGG